MKKRILSILLAALMLLSALPLGIVDTAWAISSRDTVVDSGTCGGTLNNSQLMKWTLTSDGTLTISGEGNMFGAPWSQYKSKIKKVVIGEGVESISDNAFHYYENLRSVSLPSTLTSIGEAAFWACSSLQSITLPNNLTNIGLNAFRACHSLTQVLIPASVTNIDGSAFECCTGLTDVVFEGNSLEFGSGATFYDCTSLKNVFFNGTRADWTASRGSSGSVLPAAAQIYYKNDLISSGTCGDNSSGNNTQWKLTKAGTLIITVGTGYTEGGIADFAYGKAPWYQDIYDSGIRCLIIGSGIKTIGSYAFADCTDLAEIIVPDGVISIGNGAFLQNSGAKRVVLPPSTVYIGHGALRDCSALTSVSLPDSMSNRLFLDMFEGCTNLKSVDIPDGITDIYEGDLASCPNWTDIYYDNWGRVWNRVVSNVRDSIPDRMNVHFKDNIYDSGSCGENVTWTLTADGTLTISGTGAMTDYTYDSRSPWYSCRTYIKRVVMQQGVTSIGDLAFWDCSGLTSVTIPDGVTSIGGKAFYYCDSLTDVYYAGTAADWAKISISEGNEDLLAAALHCKPTPLTAPSVTGGNDSQGRPTLKWNAVSGAAKYEVYRSYSQNGNYSKYSTQTSTGYTNSSYLTSGSTYYYKVRALDANGTAGPWSDVVAVTCRLGLTAPSVTGGNDAQGRPTLKWNAVTGAAKYEVYRARSRSGEYIKYSTVTGTSYTNTSYIENGNTYYYKVRALNANGTAGAWSSVVSVTYKQTLSAPTVTGGNDNQGRPTLTWKAVTGAAKYEVYRARSKDGDYIKYSTVTGTSYTNTSYIENGNTYYYKVRALDANGTAGAWSSVVSVTYKQTLSAPTVTGGNDAQGRPTLKWNAVTGAAKYEVYRARSKDGDYIKYSTVTGTSYTNTSYIENGNTYYYKVRALKSDGTASAWSSIVSVTYKQTLPAPTVTGGNDAQGRPTLTWKAVSGAAKYEVYRARSKDGDYIKYSTVTGTSYTNTSYIENGNTYYYKVRALKSDGTAGAWSSVVSVTYRAASTGTLPAPTVTGGNDAQGRPTLKWNAVTGAAKYEVYRARSKDGDYIKYSTVTGTSYTNISYIENGNTYYYKVRALKSDGTAGAWSSIVSVTYRAASTGTLPAPTVTGGNDSQGRPTLKWNAVTGAAKYEVYRARSLNGDYIKYSTVTGTSYTNISYIENGNTYYYKVRALKSDGTAGAWSSIVSVTYRKPAAATVASGKCGDSAKWKLDAEGTLTISGTGRMYDYEWPADRGGTTPPWLANKYRDSIRALRVEQGITYIGRCAFDSCGNLSDVTLPTSLRIIGQCAFNDCTALRSIQLPEGLTTIMEDAFNAAGLVSITFPSTLGELRDGAFMNCEKLQSLRLPEGLTTIGNWAFYCNPNISSIYIPAPVTTIGEEAFIYYNNLATVRYGGSQSQWSAVSVAANAFPDGVRYVYNVN